MRPIEKVKEYLQKQEIRLEVIEFPEGTTATSEAAAKALGVTPAQIAKTLLFVGKEKNVLVVTCGDEKVDSKKLKQHFGGKYRFARPEEVEEITGFSIGGVCPFALKNEVKIVLDASLAKFSVVYAAAGSSGSAVPANIEQLQIITGGEVLAVCV